MNKFEAIAAMRKGLTVKHSSFTSNEWIREYDSGRYEFEDGCRCEKDEFWKYRTEPSWDRGWIIVDAKDCAALSDHLFGRGLLDVESMLVYYDEITEYLPFNKHNAGVPEYTNTPPGCNGMKKPVQFHRESWRRK